MVQIPDPGLNQFRKPNVFPTNYKPARSFDEIGRAMGISRSSAHTLYARALHKIRRELRRHPDRYFAIVR